MNSLERPNSRGVATERSRGDPPERISRVLPGLTTALIGVALCFLIRDAFDLWVATLSLCAAAALIIIGPEPISEV